MNHNKRWFRAPASAHAFADARLKCVRALAAPKRQTHHTYKQIAPESLKREAI